MSEDLNGESAIEVLNHANPKLNNQPGEKLNQDWTGENGTTNPTSNPISIGIISNYLRNNKKTIRTSARATWENFPGEYTLPKKV